MHLPAAKIDFVYPEMSDNVIIEKRDNQSWMVVRTKARCEKKFAEYCAKRGCQYYLPLRRSIRRYRTRSVEFMVPLFPGYVFAQVAPSQKLLLQESTHTATVLVPDSAMESQLVDELNGVQLLVRATSEGELVVRPEIQRGRAVWVRSGPLSGMSGIVIHRKNKTRLVVNVEMIGQSVMIDMDVDELILE